MDGADANTTGPTRSSVVVEEDPPKVSDPGLSLENSPSTPQRVTDDAGEPLKVAPSSDTADVPAGEVAPEEQRDLAGPESLTTLPPNGGDLVDDSNSGEPTPDDDGVDNIEVREQQDATVDETAGEPLKVDDQDSLKSRRSVNEAADSSGDRGSMHGESVPRAHTLEGEDATTAGTAAENASASLSPPRSREAEPEHHETLIGQFETAPDNGAECDNLGSAVELPLPQSSMNGNEGIPAERLPSTGRKTVGTSARSSVPGGHNGEGTGSHQRQTPRSVKGSADRTGVTKHSEDAVHSPKENALEDPIEVENGGMRGVESARAAEDDALQHEENRLNSVNPEIPSSSQEAQTDLPSRSVPRASLAQEGDSSSEDIDIPPLRPSGGALSPARRSEEDNAEQVRTSAISPRKSPDLRTSEINGRLSAASPSKTQSADEAAAAITTELRASPQSRTSRHSRQEDFENRALKHSASSTSDQRQTSARALQSSAANSKTGTPEKDMTGASSGRDASVVSQSFQGEDKVPTMRSERPSILRHMDDFGTAISAKISKQPQVVKLTDSSTSPASTAHQSQVAVQAAELSSTALEPAKSSASTLRKERGSAGIKPAKPLLSTIADSPRVQSAVSEKNTAPSAAANAEHLMRIQSLLTQRLHTVSTGSALPHFNFDMSAAAAASRDELMNPRVGKHKNRLPAGVDPSTRRKATPPKLAPLVSHGIASLQSRTVGQNGLSNSPAPVILRAKKPVVVPASSRQTRSGGLRQDQQSTGQLDPAVLQSVIRPRGTHASPLAPPEEDLSRRIFYESPKWSKGAFSAMGNVVPPIPSSAESSSAVGQFPPTSLPVGKKGPSEDLPQNKPRTLSAKDRLAAVVASQLPQSRTAATGGRAAAVGSIRWMEQNASMPDAFLRVDAISTVPRMPKFKDPFDFIAYIQKQRHSDEFVYLRPIRAAGRALFETYNPYNLEIVEYEDLETGFGFYTLSRMGMTHVNANGRGDFTPLSQWIREHKLFNALLKIPFFARYKTWKAFSTWRRNVRRFKIRNAKAYLNKNAFILQPCLRQSLLSIVVHAQQVLNYRRFFFVNLSKTYELSEFVAEQQKRIEDIRTNVLRNWEASTRGDVEKAGLAAMSEKGFDVTLKEDMPRDENSGGHAVLDAAHKGGALPGALEGPAEKPPPVQLSFTEQAARRAECKRMQRFVKLVDYIIVHTLHMLAVESARDMLTAITRGCADEDVAMVEPEEDALEGRGGSRRLGWQAAAMKSAAVAAGGSLVGLQRIGGADPATSGSASSLIVKAGPGGAVSLPVGGVVVGKEVGTQELVQCGYYGFASILTRIKRSRIQPVELHDPVVELEPGSGGADAELAAPPAAKLKPQKQSNTTEVIPATKKFVPMFRLQLLIDTASESRHLHFAPELVQFLEAIDTILKSYVSTLEETHLISGTIPFLDPAKLAGTAYSSLRGLDDIPFTEGPSASAIVVEGGYFREVCGRIRGTMVGLFSNATKWMQQWDGLRQMWIVNEKFTALEELFHDAGPTAVFLATLGNRMSDVGVGSLLTAHAELMEKEERDKAEKEGRPFDESLVAKKDVLELGSTVTALPDGGLLSPVVNFFGNQLARFADEKERMAEIPALYVLNNVSIDTIELKKVLAPSPERCFSEVSGLLPPLARDKNELLLNEVQTWIRVLNSQPQTVELFVEYLGWLEKVKQSMPLVQLLHEEVTKLYVIMANYKTPIQPTDFAMYQTLSPALRQLKEVLDMAGDTKDDNITRFSGELDKLMNDLMQEVSEIRNRVQEPMVLNPNSASDLVIQFIDELNTQLQRANATKLKYERWSDLFKNRGVAPTEAPSADQKPKEVSLLDEAKAEVELKRSLWISLRDWDLLESSWKSKPFETLNTEEMNSQIAVYLKTVYNLDKGLPPNDVVPKLKAKVEHFRSLYSTIVDLRNPALKPRHWERIQETIGKPLIRDEHFTLETLLDLQLFSFKEEIGQISSQAGSEAALEEMLTKVVRLWSETEFIVLPYRDSKDVFILGSVEDIQTQLEDSQVTIATIKSSRFIGPIKSEVERWDKQLSLFSETLEAWLICQRNWLYLESIFSAPDIQRQLPDEARMFSQVDRSWKDVMRKASRNPNAMKNGTTPGLLETMNQNNNLLEQIQKCLEDYLESKRLLFPRFYFLSNDELLEILSQTRNPQAVQPHLSKCFDAIKSLEFGGDAKSIDIFAMISPEGERVPFLKTVKARGNVEGWLGSVEEAMVSVLKRLIKTALVEYEGSARTDWLKEHVGQAVLAANQIIWSRDASEAIKSSDPAKALVQFRNKCISNLSGAASLVRGDLTKIQRAILGAVITIDVHNRDIVQSLVNSKVSGIGDFEWVKQQRYYWDVDSDSCTVRMASSSFLYGYEYLGCSPRLVITPLTDRCYLTLCGAMQLNLGGSPVGPAGTGKTETVKDLGKALARQCVVFNCSDGLDYKMMGKMFAGLAQSGAWCCFDEFNRIDIEVLSVIAQQLLTIKNAKDLKLTKFNFEGREIRLIDTCAAFITMNPGYAGRTELPDNLKALFRPIAMMIPDYGLIAEIMLFSEGFENAKVLAGKVVNLYKLCSEQLSQQDHYDFGMRAVKSVLIMAGSLKRASPDLSEDVVLIRSLRDSNLPKFLAEDVGLFRGILQDLFPGVTCSEKDFELLSNTVRAIMSEKSLEIVDAFISRVCQLYETMKIRHGVMLVGPTGGGKTTCYELLQDACGRIKEKHPSSPDFQKVKTWVLNPKCVAMTELYGEFNLATMEWKDGLIGVVFREQVADTSPDEKWTVCDGPVDALWIENMNTVLDDNKLLTLINGERIKMSSSMHMLFEVADLAVASPATVSRCGMVYMDPTSIGWWPFVKKWLRQLPDVVNSDLREVLTQLFGTFVEKGLQFIRRNCKEYINSVNLNLVASLCKLITTFINRPDLDYTLQFSDIKSLFSHIFVFCYVWSLGGNLADGYQDSFDSFVRESLDANPIPDVHLPSTGNVFSFFVDFKNRGFTSWDEMVPQFEYSSETPYFKMIVPTPETVKYSYLLEALLTNGFRTLFSGNTGVGKSVIVQDLLSKISRRDGFLPLFLNFSAQTSSAQTQQIMELKLEKKRKNISGAPTGFKKIVLFVDDLNMPKLDTYGSQPPIELLRQYVDFGGFYDREKLTWKVIQDIELVACCAPPGGGRNNVTPRFLRHFNILNIPAASDYSLGKIFKSIVEGFLKPFTTEIRQSTEAIVTSAIEVYHCMCTELLPTPAKSHYTFNLRDLSKVVQGILQVKPQHCTAREDIARLFCHEASRVFHDRLIDGVDRAYFNQLLSTIVDKNFGTKIPPNLLAEEPIMFGDFLKRGVPPSDREYVEIEDMKGLNHALEEYLEEYNVTMNKEVRLIFFLDARQHISRISRILRQPRGNALLVGVGGTGKQSLTRLACHISDYHCFQVELTRTYGDVEWREDLKKLYISAGLEGKQTVFLLSDTQIKKETFLEDINSVLNSGEVPNLFELDEREKILGQLRPILRERGEPEDRDTVFQFFISRVRDNLHIVLATSPVGDTFRNRCRMFPSLVNCSTIDWFDEWPEDALLSVSQRFLEFVDLGSDDMKSKIATMCVEIHMSVGAMAKRFYEELRRRYYTTPTSYLELINLYVSMLQEKRRELGASRDRLRNGLNKLLETNDLVANMQVELQQLGPELQQRAADTEALMVKISKDQETADGVRKVVAVEETAVREKAVATEAIAAEAQKDLDEALPALEAAYKALDALEKKDIAELKVFSKPPDLVLLVMEAICILFKVKPDWDSSKKLLSDPQFMKKMAEYDKDNIPEAIIKKLQKYVQNPGFNPETVEKVSRACKSMVMWVIAMDLYSRVFKEVAPKRRRLEEAQQTLEQTMAKLAEKTAALQDVENQLDKLKQKYESSIASKKILADKMEETTLRLARASKLTLALADEQVRWSESVNALNEQIEALIGNIFLCAASVAYYGAFTSVFRQELVVLWIRKCQDVGVPVSETFQLVDHLAEPAVVRDWNIQGLPADTLSTENGILVMRGRRWPLMIDPQGQANRWIRNLEGNNLKVIKLTESKFLRSLENAVRTGQAVLIEDVGETLDPALEPLLLKQITRQGGRLMMKLGDSLVEYDRNFRLYITTKLANPHYLPEICIKVTIINFTVTPQGLEGQLLADVVKLERPELEEQRNSLIVNIANDKKQLKDIEDKILKMLFNSQGNILDDEELIDTLNQSKVTSAAIKERVVQAEVTELEINSAREKYRPVAIRGYLLYFVVADLSEMDPMYQFSLKYFKNLFNLCIIESPRSDNLSVRIQTLCKNCTAAIFSNVSRGLFESHKLIYAFMIAIAIMRQRGDILDAEWNFFLRGGARLAKDLPSKPNFRWLSQNMWQNIYDLSTGIPQFNYLVDHISMYGSEWEDIINSDNPFLEPIPGNENHRLSDFHRLILVKVIWEEKLVAALIQFVKANLGQEFIDIPPLDLAKSYKDTEPSTPMIFILSVGSDPVSLLMKLASSKDLNMLDRLHMISLGQGQGPIAEELLRRAIASGDWVFLQNCHLAKSWMNRLETIIKEFSLPETKVHPSFRLFLSSMPSKIFPISVLQDGVKVTNEPPKGLRANVARSFADISQDLFEENAPQGVKFRKLLFGLCFFNAIIHERKKFGPLGWNILYDWSNADLEVSITILKNTLRDSPKSIPWDALLYLTGDITFGGRVTDDWDRRTLKSILAKYYTTSIFDDAYRFSPSGIYFAPPDGDLAAFRTYIDSLPFTEEPSIFGMHENANISFQLQEAKRIVKSILDVQPRLAGSGGGAGAGMSSEELVAAIASQVLENLPNLLVVDLDTDIIRPDTRGAIVHTTNHVLEMMFKKDESGRMLNSLSTVLMQEAARFNKLLTALKASLENLLKAVKGLVVMSFELELVFNSLLNNEVPAAWANIAYPSLKPLASWVKDLKLRVEFLYNWIDKGQPSCFWLPGLFFPQGFLTGVLQNHARKYNVPIDSLLFAYRATEYEDGDPAIDNDPSVTGVDSRLPALPAGDAAVGGTAPPPPPQTPSTGSDPSLQIYPDCDSVLIRGLFIEGARWNRKKRVLQDSYPMEMFSTMPLLRFIPTQTPQDDPKLYSCPLYKTSARAGTLSTTGHSTNFVIAVKLPTDRPPDYWIAKGVALLCQLTE